MFVCVCVRARVRVCVGVGGVGVLLLNGSAVSLIKGVNKGPVLSNPAGQVCMRACLRVCESKCERVHVCYGQNLKYP